MPYEQKFIMCDTYAHTIDMSKSSAEGARKYLLYVRFRVIKFKSNNCKCTHIEKRKLISVYRSTAIDSRCLKKNFRLYDR